MIKLFQNIDQLLQWVLNKFNEKQFLNSTFKNKKITFIDVGTNFGGFYFKISKILNIKRALLIDPFPKISKSLPENITILKIALTDKKIIRNFYQHYISSQSSFYKRNDKLEILSKIKKKSKINCDTLDNIFYKNNLKFIDLLKIDAQHEEYNILKGSSKILKKKISKCD